VFESIKEGLYNLQEVKEHKMIVPIYHSNNYQEAIKLANMLSKYPEGIGEKGALSIVERLEMLFNELEFIKI
jgi:hypothetical protein